MPNLSELYLDDNLSYITDMSVEQLLKFVTKLKTLSLAGTSVSFHPGTYHRYYPRGSENEDASNLVLTFNQILSHIIKNATSINHLDFSKTNFNDKAALLLSKVNICAPKMNYYINDTSSPRRLLDWNYRIYILKVVISVRLAWLQFVKHNER